MRLLEIEVIVDVNGDSEIRKKGQGKEINSCATIDLDKVSSLKQYPDGGVIIHMLGGELYWACCYSYKKFTNLWRNVNKCDYLKI